MTSLREYSMNISEKDYHAYDAWSYSVIAKYAKEGFDAMSHLHDYVEQTPAMRFGSLFDSMVTKGRLTAELYEVMDNMPPQQEKNVWDYLLFTRREYKDLNRQDFENAIQATGYHQSGNKWGYDACMKHLLPYIDYYNARVRGKEIVSTDEWNDAFSMLNILHSDKVSGKIFKTEDTDSVEYIYQSQFLHDMTLDDGRVVSVKIMPDLLVVDHANKSIRPVDLKTSVAPAFKFYENFIKLRYDIQASLYTDVLREVLNDHEEYRDYTILPYFFTDISRSDKIPVTFDYDPNDISQSEGFSYTVNDNTYTYKGWRRLLSEIIDYEETDAKVPSYIDTTTTNNLLEVIRRAR